MWDGYQGTFLKGGLWLILTCGYVEASLRELASLFR